MRTKGPGESAALLGDVVKCLSQHGIGYAVIGAMAAAFHGIVRSSLDADALVFLRDHSLRDVQTALDAMGAEITVRRGDEADPIPALIQVADSHGNSVDLLMGLRGLDPKAPDRTVTAEHAGQELRFIGLEDFVAMKLYAGGPVDLEDARAMLSLRRDDLDLRLVDDLAARFGDAAVRSLERIRDRATD
ncbi:MAG: hypothetical protein O2923_07485 [Verrucomicrobia bacterium]|nr:hypothetical protein [Verrucomicrobiota bacterium]MDA1086975.1 hypothetical protein [Verrucomicrobiota bacterium]